jgi:hypothetical protein
MLIVYFCKMSQVVPSADSSAQEYLDRYGVTTYLKDVITLVLENRPDDPIDFIGN